MNGSPPSDVHAADTRRRWVHAWNDTMIRIWQEQITLLAVVDTGALLRSPAALAVQGDAEMLRFRVAEEFLEHGLWQDYGTGRETPRGGSGDLGYARRRQRRRWFSRKYYASVMNMRDFLAESIGRQYVGILSNAISTRPHKVRL